MKKKLSINFWAKYFTKREQLWLLIILIVGLGLRIINALSTQLWRDEVYVFFSSRNSGFLDLLLQKNWDVCHPPLYFLFLRLWQKISIDPLFLRLPSLIATLFVLVLVPVLAKRMFPKLALFPILAAFFYAFSHTQISLNMTVRPYSIEILLVIISLLLFLQILKNRKIERRLIINFAVVNFLVLFQDYSGVWLIISYGVYFFIYYLLIRRGEIVQRNVLLKSFTLTGLLYSPWLFLFIKNFREALGLVEPGFDSIFESLNPIFSNLWQGMFFTGVTLKDVPVGLGLNVYHWVAIIFLLSLIGLLLALSENIKVGVFLIIGFIVPVTFSFLFSVYVSPIFLGRNLFIFNLILIFGISYLTAVIFNKQRLLLFPVLIFWIYNFLMGFPGLHYVDPPYDWRKLTRVLGSYSQMTPKYLISMEPFYVFDPLHYWSLFWPVGNLKVMEYQEVNPKEIFPERESKIIFIVLKDNGIDFSFKKNSLESLAEELGCSLEKKQFDYMYFAECK